MSSSSMESTAFKHSLDQAISRLQQQVTVVDHSLLQDLRIDPTHQDALAQVKAREEALRALRTSLKRELDDAAEARRAACQYAKSQMDEQLQRSLYQEYRTHWATGGGDAADAAVRALVDQVDVALESLQAINTPLTHDLGSVPVTEPMYTLGAATALSTTRQHQTQMQDSQDNHPTNHELSRQSYWDVQQDPIGQDSQGFMPINPPSTFAASAAPNLGQQPSYALHAHPYKCCTQQSITAPITPHEQTIRLPRFELPIFSGSIEAFPEFWNVFESAVHTNRSIPPTVKFHHLRSRLAGDALAMVSGYDITDENYALAVNTLKETYYRPQLIRSQLSVKLLNLPPAETTALHQRTTLAQVKSLWCQLKNFGEHDSNIFAMRLIRSKFPHKTLEHLGQIETAQSSSWQVPQLLDGLDKAIRTFETIADTSVGHVHSQALAIRSNSRSSSREQKRSRHRSKSPPRRQRSPSRESQCICTFCLRQGHNAVQCQIVTTPRARRMIVYSDNLCYKCFAKGHRTDDCEKSNCIYCKGKHHKSVCRAESPQSHSRSPSRERRDSHNTRGRTRRRSQSPYTSADSRRRRSSPYPRRTRQRQRNSVQNHIHALDIDESDDRDEEPVDCESDYSINNFVHLPTSAPRLMVITTPVKNNRTQEDELLVLLLDSGAQHSFIKEDTAQRLGLVFRQPRTFITRTFGGHYASEVSSLVFLTLHDKLNTPMNFILRTRKVTTSVPADIHMFRHDARTVQARRRSRTQSPVSNEEVDIDILIGIDYYWEIVQFEKTKRLQSGLTLTHTRLGPILSGSRINTPAEHACLMSHQYALTDRESDLDRSIRRLWELETVGITDSPSPQADAEINAEVVRRYYATVQVRDGYIYVQFPWKKTHIRLADNRQVAFRRLQRVYEELNTQEELWKQYIVSIEEQLRCGIIEEVDEFMFDGPRVYYMPHRAVLKQDSLTSAIRIVFDASSHTKESPSLNDCLHQGPSLLPDLAGTLLRSRIRRYLVIADVEKAFHQIRLQMDQRDVTRFLWLKDPWKAPSSQNLRIFRFTRVVFGINVSPFLLNMSIKYALERDSQNTIREELLANTYVDNVLIGANSTRECIAKQKECKQIFTRMHMNLREFMCNNASVMEIIAPKDRMKRKTDTVKLLGVRWNPEQDTLHVHVNLASHNAHTKRTALRALASNFDPLGYLSPLFVQPKIFIQDLWTENFDWDQEFADKQHAKWQEIVRLVDGFRCSIPRLITYGDTEADYELLVFADASQRAYAAVAYLLSKSRDGTTQSHLLMARSRLAPTERATIPRLELMALETAVSLAKFLHEEVNIITLKNIRFFSDSLIALHWIHTARPLKTFVSNRVKRIQQALADFASQGVDSRFYYVASEANPADCATRGLSAEEIAEHIWWNGPPFVLKSPSEWPNWNIDFTVRPPPTPELDVEFASEHAIIEQPHYSALPFKRTNDYQKLIRITAYVLKFIRFRVYERIAQKSQVTFAADLPFLTVTASTVINAQDYKAAEFVLIREHQRECEHLMNDKPIRTLSTFQDDRGLIRVNNRQAMRWPIRPILLWPTHPLTHALITLKHRQLHHAGVPHLLAMISREYFIPRFRRLARKILNRCVTCRRLQGRPYAYPTPPDLPIERVTQQRPFRKIGLDYFGPFTVTTSTNQALKVWICLFTCMVTRALHLELVYDNSSKEFLLAFRRFIARRGSPDLVVSDNAPTFKLGREILTNELVKFEKDAFVCNFITQNALEWQFITPLSPWKGGFYERLVGITKLALKKTFLRNTPHIRSFETILTEVEAILNTRPLTQVSQGTDKEVTTLRPIDLITPSYQLGQFASSHRDGKTQKSSYYYAVVSDSETRESLQLQHDSLQDSLEYFWQLWHSQYLQILAERSQKKVPNTQSTSLTPAVGDVVIVQQTNIPRTHWPLGLIVRLNPSQDGQLRTVEVKLGKSLIVKRSTKQLIPLELHAEVVEESTTETLAPTRKQPSREVKRRH